MDSADDARFLGIEAGPLPIVWDADFRYGPRTASGRGHLRVVPDKVSSCHVLPAQTPTIIARLSLSRLRLTAHSGKIDDRVCAGLGMTASPVLCPSGSAEPMAAKGVRRDKAALSSGCKPHPAIRSLLKTRFYPRIWTVSQLLIKSVGGEYATGYPTHRAEIVD
jgi:hypothetical protein